MLPAIASEDAEATSGSTGSEDKTAISSFVTVNAVTLARTKPRPFVLRGMFPLGTVGVWLRFCGRSGWMIIKRPERRDASAPDNTQSMTELLYADMGRIPYETGLRLQQKLLKHVRTHADERAYLILGEHDPPVVTLGVGASEKNIRASSDELSAAGIEVHKTRRGGDVTYHGPGQLVGYPILRLDLHGRDLHRYLRDLEEVLIRTLRQMSIDAGRKKGYTGVWIGNEKVAAIGVAVSRWVTYHGFALNVSPDMEHFDLILPCGLGSASVTSLERVLGTTVETGPIAPLIVKNMVEIFGFTDAIRICRDDLCKRLPASG